MSSSLVRTSSNMTSADLEGVFNKIQKEQASQLEALRVTKRAMDKTLQARENGSNSKSGSSSTPAMTLASLSFEILAELMDELVLDVVAEAHRDIKAMRSICPICKTKCKNYIQKPGLDIFGNNPNLSSSNQQSFECMHCQRSYPSARYAPHLEKCMGIAGRNATRSRRGGNGRDTERAGSSSPFTPISYSDDKEISGDSDKELLEKKRKKKSVTYGGQGSGGSGYSTNTNTPAKSSSSSSPHSGNKAKKQKLNDTPDVPAKNSQKSSLLAKATSKQSSSKLKGLGLSTAADASTRASLSTPIGEISLGFLDDNVQLAAAGGGASVGTGSSTAGSGGNGQKRSSSHPKGSGTSSSSSSSSAATVTAARPVGGAKRPPGSQAPKNGLKKSSSTSSSSSLVSSTIVHAGHVDNDFIDIDGDDESVEVLQSGKSQKRS